MTKAQKLLAFTAALTLLTGSLASCGGTGHSTNSKIGGSNGTSTASTGGSGTGGETVGNLNVTGLPIVNEKEEFTIAWPRGSYSIIDADQKDAIAQAEADTNIHINWMEIEDTAWTEKTNVMLASQDLPDAFIGNIPIATNLEAFVDLTEMIPTYATNLQAAIEQYPVIQTYLTEADGSIRSLATSVMLKADETTSAIYWINEAWLEAVGKEMPTTLDEFYDVLVAFRDGDPNGNGQKDEIPFSFCNANWAGNLSSMFGPFGVLNPTNHVLVENDKVIFQPTQEGFRKALEYFHMLYTEGLFDAEGFTQTTAQHTAKINQNILGIMPIYDPTNVIGAGHAYTPLHPIKGEDGGLLYEGSMEPKVVKGVTITVACEHPEALVRFYDYVNSSMESKLTWSYGREGYLWTLNEDGSWNQITDNLKEGEVWDRMRYTAGFGPSCFPFYTPEESALIADRFVQDRLDAVAMLEQYYPKQSYHAVADDPEVISEKNLLQTEIDAYVTTFVAESVMNGLDDAAWQNHLNTCKSLNVDRYLELMQIPYDKFNEMTK